MLLKHCSWIMLAAAGLSQVAAYPFQYSDMGGCTYPAAGYHDHGAPVPNPDVGFEVSNSQSQPVTEFQPGEMYYIKLTTYSQTVPVNYWLHVTAGAMSVDGVGNKAKNCSQAVYSYLARREHYVSWTAPQDAECVTFRCTQAFSPSDAFHTGTLGMCTAGAAPAALQAASQPIPGQAPGAALPEGEGAVLPEGEGAVLPEGEGAVVFPEGEGIAPPVLPEGEGLAPPADDAVVLPEGEGGVVLPEGEGLVVAAPTTAPFVDEDGDEDVREAQGVVAAGANAIDDAPVLADGWQWAEIVVEREVEEVNGAVHLGHLGRLVTGVPAVLLVALAPLW